MRSPGEKLPALQRAGYSERTAKALQWDSSWPAERSSQKPRGCWSEVRERYSGMR